MLMSLSHVILKGTARNCRRCLYMSTKMDDKRPEHLELTADQSRDPSILDATIECIKDISPTVKGFTLKMSHPGTFKAGQWVDFFIPGIDKVGGFSMCGPPSRYLNEACLDMAVKYSKWPPAFWLHTKATQGSKVSVRIGGNFHYPNEQTEQLDGHDLLLVAGGVGINPLASIYLHAAQVLKATQSHVHLLFSARSSDELLFKSELDKVALANVNFNTTYFTTGDNNGRINRDSLEQTLSSLRINKSVCFVCGPPDMIKSVAKDLESLGMAKSNIFYELWW